ncbi:GNAT family N-acetyltransferase [Amycolatopsis mongoliensis]|uniref:GNAT family N-acetyltransferase n=1 Tax=Amycolatopsis mongoliensis TaxID=715475 RepID=A0A9Y2JZB9_9PSEU|nr:GNAT family N-acetyltransferase [Amycolatopsis sp. 4-36]WIY06700.1 GNAT family N-acetyltransferase [Amycolatopsis sp. 4-36]
MDSAQLLTSDVRRAERALHRRTSMACEAASAAGVPGRFRAWDEDGLLAVLATDPALGYLSTVSGVTPETLPAVAGFVHKPGWDGAEPTVVAPAGLPVPGLVPAGERILAVLRLEPAPAPAPEAVDEDTFLRVLLAGFEAHGTVAAFMAAEHRHPRMRRFQVLDGPTPIAAAGMTLHDDVAVLGAASTLREHRGRGAQPQLLRRRLEVAAAEGCTLAVATARPGSPSAANLERAGFHLHRRTAWRKP